MVHHLPVVSTRISTWLHNLVFLHLVRIKRIYIYNINTTRIGYFETSSPRRRAATVERALVRGGRSPRESCGLLVQSFQSITESRVCLGPVQCRCLSVTGIAVGPLRPLMQANRLVQDAARAGRLCRRRRRRPTRLSSFANSCT